MSLRIELAAAVLAAASVAGTGFADPPAGAPPAGAPATPPVATKDADAAQFLKDLPAKMSKESDTEAEASIKKLIEIWKDKDVTDATKKPVPDLLEKYAKEEKSKIAVAAIGALGELGPAAGAGPVVQILEKSLKAKEPALDIYGTCLASLKKLADPKPTTVKALVDLLKFKLDDVVAKAADAMAGYKDAPGKVRRDMLEELIKQTEGVFAQSKDAKNGGQVRKWNVIGGSVTTALKALSGQALKDPEEARKWFNEHKKDKSWDT